MTTQTPRTNELDLKIAREYGMVSGYYFEMLDHALLLELELNADGQDCTLLLHRLIALFSGRVACPVVQVKTVSSIFFSLKNQCCVFAKPLIVSRVIENRKSAFGKIVVSSRYLSGPGIAH